MNLKAEWKGWKSRACEVLNHVYQQYCSTVSSAAMSEIINAYWKLSQDATAGALPMHLDDIKGASWIDESVCPSQLPFDFLILVNRSSLSMTF